MKLARTLVWIGFVLFAPSARANLIYVLNSGDATISLIDSVTRTEIRRIPALREPHHLTLTPDGRDLLIADSGGNELFVMDPATAEVRRRVRVSNPYHLAYSPDGKFLVVASLRRNQVDIYDARDLSLLQRLRVGDKPSHIAFDPESRMAYVTLQGVRSVVAIDLATRQPAWQAEVGREPAGITWVRGRLLVGVMGESHFAVLNPETRQVERQIPIGRGAHTIFPSPDGSVLYGTSRVDSRIIAINPETLEITHSYEVPGGPDCIAFDPEGRIWVTLRWVQRVGILDPRTGDLETIRVGRSPHGVFVQPVRGE
ncbi:MAG: cytochrome [Rhodospirillales bacterium]|jgi:YVTN family beta-propeller protein|nr:cytochrome [Rhodospirillales bacterium]